MAISVIFGDPAIPTTTANDRQHMDFLLTFTSNHASISLGFQHIYDDVGFFGFKNVLATAGGHRSMHADRWVQLPVLGFLIVFCNNHYSKMHRF